MIGLYDSTRFNVIPQERGYEWKVIRRRGNVGQFAQRLDLIGGQQRRPTEQMQRGVARF